MKCFMINIYNQQTNRSMSIRNIIKKLQEKKTDKRAYIALQLVSDTISLMLTQIYQIYEKFQLKLDVDSKNQSNLGRHIQKMITAMTLPVQLQMEGNRGIGNNFRQNQRTEGNTPQKYFYNFQQNDWKNQPLGNSLKQKIIQEGKFVEKLERKNRSEQYRPQYQENILPFFKYRQRPNVQVEEKEDAYKPVHWKIKEAWLTKPQQLELKNWIIQQRSKGKWVPKARIQEKAKQLSLKLDFQASTHWLRHYINRHKLRPYVSQFKNFCGWKKEQFGKLKLWNEKDQFIEYFEEEKKRILKKQDNRVYASESGFYNVRKMTKAEQNEKIAELNKDKVQSYLE